MSPVKTPAWPNTNRVPRPAPITTVDPGFVIAGVDDLAIRGDIASASGHDLLSGTRGARNAHLALHPEDAGNLQIVPLHEVAA